MFINLSSNSQNLNNYDTLSNSRKDIRLIIPKILINKLHYVKYLTSKFSLKSKEFLEKNEQRRSSRYVAYLI